MNVKKTHLYLLLIGIVLSCCAKRDAYECAQSGLVEIALDWGQETIPSEVCYLFYGHDGKLVESVVGSSKGVTRQLPVGVYHVVIYNNNAQGVGYRGLENHNTAEIFAHEVSTAKGAINSTQIHQPQQVFGASSCQGAGVLVVEKRKTKHCTIEPKSLTTQVNFIFSVMSTAQVEELSGTLNGIVPSLSLTSGKSNPAQNGIVSFSGISTAMNTYNIRLEVFGFHVSEQSYIHSNIMELTLKMDGKQYEVSTDLTQVIDGIMSSNPGVPTIDTPIEVEVVVDDVGLGATVTVKPWTESGTGSGIIV